MPILFLSDDHLLESIMLDFEINFLWQFIGAYEMKLRISMLHKVNLS